MIMRKTGFYLAILAFMLFLGNWLNGKVGYPSFSLIQVRRDELIELHSDLIISQSITPEERYLHSLRIPVFVEGSKSIPQFTVRLCIIKASIPPREIKCENVIVSYDGNITELVLAFPSQDDSFQEGYYLTVESDVPKGVVFLYASSFDAYSKGKLTINSREQPGDLSFSAIVRPPFLYLTRYSKELGTRLLYMFAFFFITALCGFGVLSVMKIKLFADEFSVRMSLYNSVGMAASIVVIYILGLFKFPVTENLIWGMGLLLLGISFIIVGVRFFAQRKDVKSYKVSLRHKLNHYDVVFFSIFLFSMIIRASQIRDLQVPNWTDGLYHYNLLDKIHSESAIPVEQIYHIGFHLYAFFLQSILKTWSPEFMLILGQWLSVSAGMGFYFLASKLIKSRIALLLCLSFYWFLAPFPSYLISWGRYPLLLGLTLLPATIAVGIDWLKSMTWDYLILVSILVTSLFITHYSVLIIWIIFVLSFLALGEIEEHSGFSLVFRKKFLVQYLLITIVLGLFLVPKLKTLAEHNQCKDGITNILMCLKQSVSPFVFYDYKSATMFGESSPPSIFEKIVTPIFNTDTNYFLNLTLDLGGKIIWVGGVTGLFFCYQENVRHLYVMIGWVLSLFLISSIQIAYLGVALPDMTNLIIFMSIPLTILSGFPLQYFFTSGKITVIEKKIALGGLLLLILIGAYGMIGIVNPATALFSMDDNPAMEWIIKNTEPDDVILINSFSWEDFYVPSDGGGWITKLTDRKTIYPTTSKKFLNIDNFIKKQKIDYVYVGQGYGDLNRIVFAREKFLLVYKFDEIKIYKVVSP